MPLWGHFQSLEDFVYFYMIEIWVIWRFCLWTCLYSGGTFKIWPIFMVVSFFPLEKNIRIKTCFWVLEKHTSSFLYPGWWGSSFVLPHQKFCNPELNYKPLSERSFPSSLPWTALPLITAVLLVFLLLYSWAPSLDCWNCEISGMKILY